MGTNIETVKAWTERYNNRDWDNWLALFSTDVVFLDLAQDVTVKGRDELLAYGKGWSSAFSDVAYTDMRMADAGDRVLFQFIGTGTNDGAFGQLPSTGKRVSFPVVNVIEFGRDGEVTRVEQLYDRLSILTQLGHAQP
jgi:steroid delta-isomerase-like uncharacterized protein